MMKRLQVLLPDDELREIRSIARRRGTTTAAWVRAALRDARAAESQVDPERKLRAVREAMKYSFPAPDIEQMLEEIERGRTTAPRR